MNYADHGYIRAAAVAPELVLADPAANARSIVNHLTELAAAEVSLALFPELCLTGYSCEDLFAADDLHRAVDTALATIAGAGVDIVAVVGAPWRLTDGRLLNCAVVIGNGRILGVVPKTALPNYGEFYEHRWFSSGADVHETLGSGDLSFLISARQTFNLPGASFAVEICEDLWAPAQPAMQHVLAGAELVLNLSASNELVAKADYRRDLINSASARGICGYLYASSGPLESSKDLLFGGHLVAAENGQILSENERFSFAATTLTVDFDIAHLRHDRIYNTTFANSPRPSGYQQQRIRFDAPRLTSLERQLEANPFVPPDEHQFDARAREILSIQSTGLARRALAARADNLVIGISGGLDSTLALLVCLDAVTRVDRSRSTIHAITMPGPGTSERTLASARSLCAAAGVQIREIPIHDAVTAHLTDLNHSSTTDVVFENAQARERTQILFNYANQNAGIVVGTGDLSELALGWCTFNADHMANYNVNAGVPKTMVAYLVRWYAQHQSDDNLARVLEEVLDTPISPELIAPADGEISQETESIIGPYELHDFFLYHTVRFGSGVSKVLALAALAFETRYSRAEIGRWLRLFIQRFYTQQFKRTTLPPGPKVGSVSLSPRGDWRMPDEASVEHLLAEIDELLETTDKD